MKEKIELNSKKKSREDVMVGLHSFKTQVKEAGRKEARESRGFFPLSDEKNKEKLSDKKIECLDQKSLKMWRRKLMPD